MDDDNTVNDQQPETPDAPKPAREPEPSEKSSLKEELREGAAKAWGIAVEVGSLLGGESGEIVSAERDIAEAEAEDFIDRIDGEG